MGIKDKFVECLILLGLQQQIMGITLDHISSNTKFNYPHAEKEVQWDEYFGIKCFAHVLNVAVCAVFGHPGAEILRLTLTRLQNYLDRLILRHNDARIDSDLHAILPQLTLTRMQYRLNSFLPRFSTTRPNLTRMQDYLD